MLLRKSSIDKALQRLTALTKSNPEAGLLILQIQRDLTELMKEASQRETRALDNGVHSGFAVILRHAADDEIGRGVARSMIKDLGGEMEEKDESLEVRRGDYLCKMTLTENAQGLHDFSVS